MYISVKGIPHPLSIKSISWSMMYSFGNDFICSPSVALVRAFYMHMGCENKRPRRRSMKTTSCNRVCQVHVPLKQRWRSNQTCFFWPVFRVMHSKPLQKKGHESIANPVKGIKKSKVTSCPKPWWIFYEGYFRIIIRTRIQFFLSPAKNRQPVFMGGGYGGLTGKHQGLGNGEVSKQTSEMSNSNGW